MKNVYRGVPKTLKIGALDYKFQVVKELKEADGTTSWGEIEYETYTISAERVQPSAASAADTLLHEILHAIWRETSLNETIDAEVEEKIVRTLTTGLVGVLRDNPAVVRWLAKRLGSA